MIYVYILFCQSVPLGNLLLQKIKDIDKYKCLYMAIFNTKNLDMKAQYLVGAIMFNGVIQGAVRWRLNTVNVIHIHVAQTSKKYSRVSTIFPYYLQYN